MLIIFKNHDDTAFECPSHYCVEVFETRLGDILISIPVEASERSQLDEWIIIAARARS